MGQRHQLFVIAKVKGRYRTLCAVHHQWLLGSAALQCCLNTLEVFQDPTNRLPIQQELAAACDYEDELWNLTRDDYDELIFVPFPFIATCLVIGSSYPANGSYHGTSIEPFEMAYNEGDNNNGITIFDITDPSNVSYCFVDYYGMECLREVPLMEPLSARTYVEAYYDSSGPNTLREREQYVRLMEAFKERSLISAAVLEDTWPEQGWRSAGDPVQGGDGEECLLQLEKLEITAGSTVKTLRDHAMNELLDSLLCYSKEDPSLSTSAKLLPDFLPRLKAKLYECAPNLESSPYHLNLLYGALQNEVDVDLSPFDAFSIDDLAFLVSKLQKNGKMTTLNLSSRPEIGEDGLETILGADPSIQYLCLLKMDQIPVHSLGKYLTECEVYHSDLLRRVFYKYNRSPNENLPPIKFPTTGIVSKLVWIGLGSDEYLNPKNWLSNGRMDWENIKLNPGDPVFGGSDALISNYDLCLPLSAPKLIESILRVLQSLGSANLLFAVVSENLSKAIACFMAATPTRVGGTGHGVGTLDPRLYSRWDSNGERWAKTSLLSLGIGEWALILVSEAYDIDSDGLASEASTIHDSVKNALGDEKITFNPRKATNYALVTRVAASGPSQFVVTDVPTYLKLVLGDTPRAQQLTEVFTKRFSSIENAGFFGEETYKILQKLSSADK